MAHRQAARTDPNHADVRDALRLAGCGVSDSSAAGKGFPDLVVAFDVRVPGFGRVPYTLLMEIKDGRKPASERKLTTDQRKFFRKWPGPKAIVYSAEEALELVRQLRGGNFAALEAEPFVSRLPQR